MKKIWYAPYKFESYGEEEIKAVEESLRSGWLGGQGPKSVEFEEKIAKRFGKKYGIFVNSGSSACLLAIAALNLPKGCKIITPACTFSTTLSPIIQLGYKPKFVDVGLNDYVADIDQVIAAITPDVKAIMLPNLIGNKPNWKRLKQEIKLLGRTDIILIEDSADTITETFESDVATTSFYASHIITAGGVGGMVMFNDKKHVTLALQYRDWGRLGDDSEIMDDRFKFESYGEEEIKAVEESLRSGWLGGHGPKSVEFEEKIAKRFGKKYGVFVNSGSSACLLAIAALNLPKGCKIITPACTFSTTLAPIIQLGYQPNL